jgi:hypothetical protein
MRFFSAARPQPSTLTAISSGLRELYTVPNDVPESFVKAFARLDSSEHQAERDPQASQSSPTRSTLKAMKAFALAIIAAVVLAGASALVLISSQRAAYEAFATSAARV